MIKQKLSAKILALMLFFLTVATISCKKDITAPEKEETTTNDPRLLGKWSNTVSNGPNSALISTYDFKAGQLVDVALLASSNLSGMKVISNNTFKWTTTNNNTVSIQAIGITSIEKYVVDGKKLVFTSSDNKQTAYNKVD